MNTNKQKQTRPIVKSLTLKKRVYFGYFDVELG